VAVNTDVLGVTDFSGLVESVYKGPLESPPWKTFLESMKGLLSASFTVIILRPAAPERPPVLVVAGPASVEATEAYNTRFFEMDPFVGLPPDRVVTAIDLIGERQWLDGTFYREYMQPLDILHILGVDLVTSEGEHCGFRATRSHAQPAFSAQDKALCQLVLPHLKQAVHLHSHMDLIESERRLFSGAIERLQVGTVTLDAKGAILSINEEAAAILAEKDGIRLTGGALQAEYKEENTKLQRLTNSALAGHAGQAPTVIEAIAITRPSGRSKLSVLIRTLPEGEWSDGKGQPRVAVFLRNPESKGLGSLDIVRRLFDLTHAEASLALLLANGLTLDEAAEQLNVRRNTARAHLRSIFSKMGVTRQTELVRLVLNSVAQLG
jgi:DNA-binding CsgD family transcriptional regulator/PAS domain-containing protein